jgi:biotin operon repressor
VKLSGQAPGGPTGHKERATTETPTTDQRENRHDSKPETQNMQPTTDNLTTNPNLITLADLITGAHQPTEWLIEDNYPTEETILFTGPSGAGKTYLALDQGLAVAYGKPWLGTFAVPEPRPVLYAPSEGRRGIGRRVLSAIEYHYPYEPVAPFTTYGGRLNLGDLSTLIPFHQAIEETRAALVVIDVLRDATPGISENSDEMGDALGLLRDLVHETGATFLIAHHTGKDPSKGSRGHSSLKDKADQELLIKSAATLDPRTGHILRTNLTVSNTKNRNEENWGKLGIEISKPPGSLAPVVIGLDNPRKEAPQLSTEGVTVTEAIARTVPELSTTVGVTYEDIQNAIGKSRTAVVRTVKALQGQGYVEIDASGRGHIITLTERGVELTVTQLSTSVTPNGELSTTLRTPRGEGVTLGQLTTAQELIEERRKSNVIDISAILNGEVRTAK